MRLRQIQHELEQGGWKTIVVDNEADAGIVAGAHRGLAAIVFGAEARAGRGRRSKRLVALMDAVHERAPGLPIIALGETAAVQGTVAEGVMQALRNIHSILYLYEDTVPFLARQIMRAAEDYLENLLPPFFKALTRHAERSAYSWHTPGHAGGVGFLKSPVGYALHEFFGENTVRSDLSISVPELGSLLDHTGPVKAAEAYAAQVFGADHTYFVTNGTSTANKIVWHSMAGRDDLVIVDRNCHKSLLHSLIMTGATPIYFTPARNDYGIIGPIGLDQFSPEAIKKKIAASPIARRPKGNVRIAVVTNSTYDGLCYNAEKIKAVGRRPGRRAALRRGLVRLCGVPRVLCRPPRDGRAARPSARRPHAGVRHAVDAQAAGRVLAGLDDPHPGIGEAQDRHHALQRRLHDARLDLAALRHHRLARRQLGDDGRRERPLDRAGDARRGDALPPRAGRHRQATSRRADWWFKVWQPDGLDLDKAPQTADWVLDPKASWHGFGKLADDYVMLDPIKVTLLTPGLGKGAKLAKSGIPAAVVTKYLWERGLVVEKTGLYSFLILFSLGITRGKWSSMVDALVDFKTDYDRNAPLARRCRASPARQAYAGWGLRDLCDALHACYRDNDTAAAMNAMYTDLPEPAMKPSDAYDHLVHGRVEPVPIDEAEGPHHRGDGRALPARHPADHARRALHDRLDHRVPEVRARHRRPLPRLRGRHPRPALRCRPQGPQDLAGRLREGSEA